MTVHPKKNLKRILNFWGRGRESGKEREKKAKISKSYHEILRKKRHGKNAKHDK